MNHARKIKITRTLTDFARSQGWGELCFKFGCDEQFDMNNNTITWAEYKATATNKRFFENALSLTDEINASPFTLIVLHEIGHYFTLDDFDDEYFNEMTAYEMILSETATRKECELFHFQLPYEEAATKWAIDFIKENQDIIKELEKKIKTILK